MDKEKKNETIICNRKGIHTCRLGAIHIPDNFCGSLEQLKDTTQLEDSKN